MSLGRSIVVVTLFVTVMLSALVATSPASARSAKAHLDDISLKTGELNAVSAYDHGLTQGQRR